MKSNTLRALVGAAILALLHTASVSCTNSGKQVEYEPLSLIPAPAVTEAAEGVFILRHGTGIVFDPDFTSGGDITDIFNGFLEKYYENIRVIEQRETAAVNIIHARYDSLIDNPEAYRLEVSGDAITIEAGNEAGLFYAFQTLMQLIWPSQDRKSVV